MLKLGYLTGIYDILRIKDLERVDKAVLENKNKGNEYFALGIYDDSLCEKEGLGTPIKNVIDRSEIAKYFKGVDFTFINTDKNKEEIFKRAEKALKKHLQEESKKIEEKEKKYDIVYAPGTYDLFHAGHLENLLQAAENSKKLIVGVKSDELVKSHKGKDTIISEQERMEILKHFKFVNDVYIYNDRDPHIAIEWIKSKYGKDVDAVYLGSD